MRLKYLIGALAAAALVAAPVSAKTLRWTSQGDILTFDPMAQNESLNNTFSDYVYEGLLRYSRKFEPEAALATSWTRVSPTQWRFVLRKNVRFHDGTPMTADDVVFSFERVLKPSSNMKVYAQGIKETRKVDDFTVEIVTDGPNPVLLRGLVDIKIMSRAWATKNNVVNPQNYAQKEESFAARNTNGTGQFMLKSREADVRTVLVINPNWWDKAPESNITEIVYQPIKQDGTRAAALLSGEIDLVLDPPTQDVPRLRQDPKLKIADGTETRMIFFGFDQWRDESPYTSVKGKNPFKDKRVRQAMYQAIDIEAIRRATMRGLAVPSGSMIAPQVNGYFEEFAKRLPYDAAAGKKLLADAGYPNGFEFTLDCPNNRYINDEEICQAVTAMWAKIGLTAKLNAMPRATYFQKIQKFDTSVYLLGWATATFDGLYTLQSLIRSVDPKGGADGNFNLGKYSNVKADALIDQVKIEIDEKKRNELMREAQRIHYDDVGHIPLHQQVIPWAMRSNVTTFHRADNRLDMRWTRID